MLRILFFPKVIYKFLEQLLHLELILIVSFIGLNELITQMASDKQIREK